MSSVQWLHVVSSFGTGQYNIEYFYHHRKFYWTALVQKVRRWLSIDTQENNKGTNGSRTVNKE